ncbi:tRNA (adenosine(37)-N6)-dimethylallyltransferase MiaA [Phenylobacterium sp.]|jgi:tRNA dimethylallyltransferase|uniref:tRNA (adenosine(37)-N6)-dimethylallyltransferase MiaA n=1 Tax=Phenylobacterium sp. TaxID=1871053 RepID=UPI002E33F915|nr:tRNA (adenosine(37)-N6)-dimethylallyltransferase MiaA [Phenylobacterium sp.]HEX2561147.1 tRNA (adenosine(37)-N6)-dimethylallyltransferase MiaA [Phenylobacterium sp.]
MEPRIWLIAGPTASGKSALAAKLARESGGEVVGADSMQLYRDLQVLTARPSPEELAGEAPHHLMGVADAAEAWSVGRWVRAAEPLIAQILARGAPAIVAGGTGLYFAALTEGLADVPEVPAEARAQTAEDYDALGEAAFRERLAGVDPEAAARIAPGDRQRLCRAWEVHAASGVSLTEWQARTRPVLAPGSWREVVLEPPRAALYARCDARLEWMVEHGALDEVRALIARGLAPDLPVMKAVGVRELADHIAGRTDLEAALAAAQRETRRYVKRQSTWLRHRMSGWPRITALEPEAQWRQFLALEPALTP